MMEYTAWSLAALGGVVLLDFLARTHLIRPTPPFLFTTLAFLAFQLVFDNLFTWHGIWVFNPEEVIGIYLPFIPLENLFFGLALLWGTLILYTKILSIQHAPHPTKT